MRSLTPFVAMALLVACSDSSTPAIDAASSVDQAAVDIGTTADKGPATDKGPTADKGTAADMGTAVDKGTVADKGATTDAAPGCAPQDIKGAGMCDMMLGYMWNGKTCVSFSGCSCTGADCSKKFGAAGGITACYKAYSKCVPCAKMDAKGQGPCAAIVGYAWDGKACVAFSGCSCAGTDCTWYFKSQGTCQAAFAHCP